MQIFFSRYYEMFSDRKLTDAAYQSYVVAGLYQSYVVAGFCLTNW